MESESSKRKWLDEVVKLVFSKNPNSEDVRKGLSIKNENVPEYIYKYMTWNEYAIDPIENNRVYLSRSDMFNDTYDCSFGWNEKSLEKHYLEYIKFICRKFLKEKEISECPVFPSNDPVEIVLYTRNRAGKEMPLEKIRQKCAKDKRIMGAKMGGFLTAHKQAIFVTCFSETYSNNLLWGNYADKHAGICIRYRSHSIVDDVWPVIYQSERPAFFEHIDGPSYFEMDEKHGGDPFDVHVPWLYFSIVKSLEWEHEQEWRIAKRNDKNLPDFDQYLSLAPDAVFLGERMSGDSVSCARAIAMKHGIERFKMHSNRNSYELVATPDVI